MTPSLDDLRVDARSGVGPPSVLQNGSVTTLRQTWILARNDLRQELRELELLITSVFFTVVILALYAVSFAEMSKSAQPKAVPGMLWIALAFVGALTLTRVFEREREADTFGALLAAPVNRVAMYGAKFSVTLAVLCVCAAVLVPGLLLVFPSSGVEGWSALEMLATVLLGCAGFAAVGTLFAAGLAHGGGKNVLLSVVLYPLTTPVLMMSLVATQRVLQAHPGAWDILAKIAAVDVILLIVGGALFESVLVGGAARGSGGGDSSTGAGGARAPRTGEVGPDMLGDDVR